MTIGTKACFGPTEHASMRLRDGVRLDADIYRPNGPGQWPVLLMRQPYGRQIASTICYAHPSWYAQRGYIVVIQDVRGRGTSEGDFKALENEAEDGAETVSWAASLPGSTGAVGMYGFSYQGSDQLLTASKIPPALKAVAPAMIGWDLRNDWAYENDAFCLAAGLGWAFQLSAETARLAQDGEAFRALYAASRALPLNDPIPARPQVLMRYQHLTHYFDWLDAPVGSDYWTRISPSASGDVLVNAGPPALFIGGWYDSHLPGTLAAYRYYADRGTVPCRLIVGPWGHFPWGRHVGTTDFGPHAIGEIDQLQLAWFDRWLKGMDDAAEDSTPIRLFDRGAKIWRSFDRWPDVPLDLYLLGQGRAAIDERDGQLVESPTASSGIEYLIHDPWRPVNSVGGPYGTPGGPADRLSVDARPDVLTFSSTPLDAPVTLAGSVTAALAVEADAPSFDLSCVLSRLGADGSCTHITEGYRRVVQASDDGVITVPMRATCITLAAGDALRLSVAGASFPAFPVNPGTGENPTTAALGSARIITIGIRHGGEAGSRLLLSCIGGSSMVP